MIKLLMHKSCQPHVSSAQIIRAKGYKEEHPERFSRKDTKEDIDVCLQCNRETCSGSKRCLLKHKGGLNNVNQN